MIFKIYMYMKKIIFIVAAVVLALVACEKTPKNEPVEIKVSLAKDATAYQQADVTISLRDLNGSASYEAVTDETGTASFLVLPGLYEASASFRYAGEGTLYLLNGINSNVTVSMGADNAFTIELAQSVSNQLVIKEFYFGGCQKNDGSGTFQNDGYVILYNNSDYPADASDICFAFATPSNSNVASKYLVDGELSYLAQGWIPAGWATWWFENTVTIEPYSQIVISLFGAINHTETYINSVDLSHADYAMYDPEVFANDKYVVSENIPSTNYLQTYAYAGGNAWPLSINSPAFYMFRHDNAEAYTSDTANYDYTMGEKLPDAKIMTEWVVDGIEVFGAATMDKNGKRFPSSIDAGYVTFTNKQGYSVYRNVDKEATEAIAGNEGKLFYDYAGGTEDVEGSTDPSGIDAERSIANGAKIVYLDSNNSTKDFHQRKYASLTGK